MTVRRNAMWFRTLTTQRVSINADVFLKRANRQLIDIAFALRVQAATTDIADFQLRTETNLTFEGSVPGPGLRILEDRVLRRDLLRENITGFATRIINAAIGH